MSKIELEEQIASLKEELKKVVELKVVFNELGISDAAKDLEETEELIIVEIAQYTSMLENLLP